MPRPPRADEAGCLYHALNRGNARAIIFHKEADYEAFEGLLAESLEEYEVELLVYQFQPANQPLAHRHFQRQLHSTVSLDAAEFLNEHPVASPTS